MKRNACPYQSEFLLQLYFTMIINLICLWLEEKKNISLKKKHEAQDKLHHKAIQTYKINLKNLQQILFMFWRRLYI